MKEQDDELEEEEGLLGKVINKQQEMKRKSGESRGSREEGVQPGVQL